jgi:hypothetical protein
MWLSLRTRAYETEFMKPTLDLRDLPTTRPARGFQGRAIGAVLGRITAPVLKKRGFREIDILSHWSVIVGPQLAAWSCPERISRNGRGTQDGAVLTVKVEGAMALEVQHMAPLILERIQPALWGRCDCPLECGARPASIGLFKGSSRPRNTPE